MNSLMKACLAAYIPNTWYIYTISLVVVRVGSTACLDNTSFRFEPVD